MNTLIAAGVGAVVGLIGTIGGVQALAGSPQPVSANTLYSYSDN